jgi:hypothetical protein
LERLYERDTRILTPAASRPQFILSFGLQCDSKPLDADRIAGFIEFHARYPYARIVSLRD